MGRARRARRIAGAAAFGGGGLGAVGLGTYGLLAVEAKIARKVVGQVFEGAPDDSGRYGHGSGDPVRLLVAGDSTARGMGADTSAQTVGAIVATAVAALSGRPVEVTNVAVVGADSTDLSTQLDLAEELVPEPDVAIVMIGANDVTHRLSRATSVRHLGEAVQRLRESEAEVVVATCPDLGVIQPVPQPLRRVMRRFSRDLAAAQTVTVVEQGGRTVSLGDLLGHEFGEQPALMFSQDRFHPSPTGYARAAAAILPSVLNALGLGAEPATAEQLGRRQAVRPVAVAAKRAVADPGTEVAGTQVAGADRSARGRWAVLLRRGRSPLPEGDQPEPVPGATTSDPLAGDDGSEVAADHD